MSIVEILTVFAFFVLIGAVFGGGIGVLIGILIAVVLCNEYL